MVKPEANDQTGDMATNGADGQVSRSGALEKTRG